ncbi:MAG: ABC transporter permease [Clostridia bacterium]|nr:ABC transporter permease [Clostridia bacterium]MBQ3478611.1 ABC transporter permease [Clostridia bacterium]MBQ6122505.1 ABC transporter permease [Clostridia bacterium]MBQ6326097.1 ABC transporter permease [Clostridia bacterium]MBQ9038071.1 ABC transporter permease [Clostridia bacterium]
MLKYVIKRLLAGVLTMVVLITVAFFMMHAMPGGPFSPSEEKNVPPEVLERIAASYGLDQPVWQQYLTYWKNLLNGDLGVSFKTVGTVREKIAGHFPYSAQVGGLAVMFSLLIGIPMGLIAALYRGKAADMATLALATVGISVPVFVLSLLLSYLFSVKLKWLPTYGLDSWACYILPVVCLSMNPIAYIARQTRSSMLEALEQDYIRTARAKGVSELMVVAKHALKNALTPIITYLGPLVAGLLTGSFVVESRFAIPGLGYYFVRSISDRDYTMIMGIVIFFGLFVVICNLVSDILLAIVDPRVKLANE